MPRIKKNGKIDGRAKSSGINMSKARSKLKSYIDKGKRMRDDDITMSDLEDEVPEVETPQDPEPETPQDPEVETPQDPEPETPKLDPDEFKSVRNIVQSPKPKPRRRKKIEIEYSDSNSDSDDNDFNQYVSKYKNKKQRDNDELENLPSLFSSQIIQPRRQQQLQQQPQQQPQQPQQPRTLNPYTNMAELLKMRIINI
jgi:hypothetical protein